jgi:hypothetical protein
MQKVTIRKTKSFTTILRKDSKRIIAVTPIGLVELGEFPIDVDVKVEKIPFNPALYGEDIIYQIKKALLKKQVKGWFPATCGKTLLSIMTNKNLRVDDKYQLIAFSRPISARGGSHE